ncbi:MAG: DUF5615 family PIN-like protein [Planctomycetaceae bacterium]|nr:DUF5615 family PIN-like protein [Planctomycetaceae bacterium]
MRLLIDSPLSPLVARLLSEAGHDCVHVQQYGLQSAPDMQVMERALAEDRIIISADSDFATLLALGRRAKPSFVLLRRTSDRRPGEQAVLLIKNLPNLEEHLLQGSIVVIKEDSIRGSKVAGW